MIFIQRILILLLVGNFILLPTMVEARSSSAKKALVVGKSALYGFGGGLVIGLASQVVKKRTKNIFLFGSLGMYAGIITGIFLVLTAKGGNQDYEGPDTYQDFNGWDSFRTESRKPAWQYEFKEDKKVELTFLNARF